MDETLERVICEVIENIPTPQSPKPADNPIEISSQDVPVVEIASQEHINNIHTADDHIDEIRSQGANHQEIDNNLQEGNHQDINIDITEETEQQQADLNDIIEETEQQQSNLAKNVVESSMQQPTEMPVETISNNREEDNEEIRTHEQPQATILQVSTEFLVASSIEPDST